MERHDAEIWAILDRRIGTAEPDADREECMLDIHADGTGMRLGLPYAHLLMMRLAPRGRLPDTPMELYLRFQTFDVEVKGWDLETLYEQLLRRHTKTLRKSEDPTDGAAPRIMSVIVSDTSPPSGAAEET